VRLRASMKPRAYEVFYAMALLRGRGTYEVRRNDLLDVLGSEGRSMTYQNLVYHLKALERMPFVERSGQTYRLVEGLYKLTGLPPSCLLVEGRRVVFLICEHASVCDHRPFSPECLKMKFAST